MSAPANPPRRVGRLRIRIARATDADAIACLSRDLIEVGLGWTWTPARVRRAICDPETQVIVASRGAGIGGLGILQFGDDEGHLALLAVHDAWRRRGVGRSLVGWLLESARCAGLVRIKLELRSRNDVARQFYEALGFEVFAVSPGYYRGREAALRMALQLRPEPMQTVRWDIPAAWRGVGNTDA